MVVRKEMNKLQNATAKIPASVLVARPEHIEEMAEGAVDSLAERIRSGRAFLKVVAYPWGVEFDVCSAEVES